MRPPRVRCRDRRRCRLTSAASRRLGVESLEDRRLLAVLPWPAAFEPVEPLGSLIYDSRATGNIETAGETEQLSIELDAGQTVTLVVDPTGSLRPTVELFDPAGTSLGTVTAAADGETAVLQTVPVVTEGTHLLAVSGAADTMGAYLIDLILNAAVEHETHGGPANGTAATAEDLDASFLSLGAGTAQRGAVVGSLPDETADEDWYRFTLADGQSSTLALTANTPGDMTLELFDHAGTLLAKGVPAENVHHVINNFVDATDDAAPKIYCARVSGSGGEYSLLVTRDAEFDTEPNDSLAQARNIASSGTVLGSLDPTSAETPVMKQKLFPSDATEYLGFGSSVSIRDESAIIGAPISDDSGYGSGSAYIFQKNRSGWQQIAKLVQDDAATQDYFGASVSMDDGIAIVGAPGPAVSGNPFGSQGSAYIFEETDSGWTQVAKLVPNEFPDDFYFAFGKSVSISGNAAIVGAGQGDGAAYIFRNNGSGWAQVAELAPPDRAEDRGFGRSVSISGDTAVVKGGESGAGAYVFRENGSEWVYITTLRSDDDRESPTGSVFVEGDTALVGGSFRPNDDTAYSSAVYSFQQIGSDWTRVARMFPDDEGHSDSGYGGAISLSGHIAVVGDDGANDRGPQSGSAYVFQQTALGWTRSAQLLPDDLEDRSFFGLSVSASGLTAMVGAVGDNTYGRSCGAVYVYGDLQPWDYYAISAQTGDELSITTSDVRGAVQGISDDLDPSIELYDPSGALVISDDNSAPDARNARLVHTAAVSGDYTVRVLAADDTDGAYVLNVSGHNGGGPSFEVLTPEPGSELTLGSVPGTMQLDFNDTVLVTSLDGADLTVEGLPATAVTVIDGDTTRFDLPTGLGDGIYTVSIAAGAIFDVQGTPIEAYSFELKIDSTPPVVGVFPHWTFDGSPPLAGSVDDPESTVELTVDGKAYSATNHGDGTWSLAEGLIDPPLVPRQYDVVVTATDALGNAGTDTTVDELTIWPGAGIRGTVFDDQDRDGIRDHAEPGIPGVRVYLDLNRNDRFDASEPSWTTWLDRLDTPDVDETGWYVFSGLEPGSYVVAEVAPAGAEQTAPNVDGKGSGFRAEVVALSASKGMTPSSLIRLDDFHADPRLANVQGQSYAAVILDTGIDLDNPCFGPDEDGDGVADRIVYQYDFVDGDNDAADGDGHGTHVAGIVASQDNRYRGVAPAADIIALRVLTAEDEGDFGHLEQALQWVIANAEAYNVVNVNMSLGDRKNHNTPQALYDVDDELATLAQMGVIVVSASGNDFYEFDSAPGVSYPAADPNSISVGAVYASGSGSHQYKDDDGNVTAEAFSSGPDRITPFSQRHATLTTVFAPGAPITGPGLDGETVSYHGTSQAAAHVSGVAVLAQQLAVEHLGRRLTPGEFVQLLRQTGAVIHDGDNEDDNVTNTGLDFRRVDVMALAEAVLAMGDLPGKYVIRLGLDRVAEGLDFGNFSQWTELGAVDFLRLDDVSLAGGEAGYSVETVRDGTLTLAAAPADDVELTLYEQNPWTNHDAPVVATSSLIDGTPRIDWQVTAGTTYYFRVTGTADEVDLTLANLLGQTDPAVQVHGTAGADQFRFAAAVPDELVINGIRYPLPGADPRLVQFHGGLGDDTAELLGTHGSETATLSPGSAVLSGDGFELKVFDTEDVTIEGQGGGDSAELYDSPGDDHFVGTPTYAAMYGEGFYNRVRFFSDVQAEAGEGTDEAKFYDSPGNDNYIGTPTYNEVSGEGFKNVARYFEGAHVYATAGGVDVAKLYDSADHDLYVATPTYAAFFSDPDRAAGEVRFFNRAKYFEGVHAYATAGGVDVAKFYDSPANDDFIATPTYAALYNPTYREEYTAGFFNRAKYFEGVHAFATAGGADLARLYDSPDDDRFVADPTHGALFNDTYQEEYTSGFYNRAKFFEGVHAFATAGGHDTADLWDSAEDDKFVATPTEGALFRPGAYYNRAKFFEQVNARALQGGEDEAYLHDSAMADLLEADGNWAQLSNGELDFANWAEGFGYVQAISSGAGDTKSVSKTVDFLFYEGIWIDQ